MSYTDDFWKALEEEEKKKKKKKNGSTTVTQSSIKSSGSSYSDEFYSELQSLQKKSVEVDNSFHPVSGRFSDDDDIAPVKEEDDSLLDFFDAGALSAWGDGKVDWDDVSALPKAILGTAGDAVTGLAKGVFQFAEGMSDAIGQNVLVPIARATGSDYADDWHRDFAESSTEKIFGGADEYLDKYSVLGRTARGVTEGVGQLAPIVAASAVGSPLLGQALLGVSSFGSGQSEAFMDGATYEEATTYGAISAGTEILSEMLFGGLGKGINAIGFNKGVLPLDDMAAKAVSKFFKSQAGKNVSEFVVKSGFEGLEEVIAGYLQAHAKKGTFKSEEDFAKILEDENLFEQFVVGSLVSGIAQSGDVHVANKTGRDFITGNTQNEQAVIDKVLEERIAEAEKNGKKLSGSEKNKILDAVVRDMERGYISTDTIEEVLGGDSYKSYKDTIAKEDAIKEEFETLKGKKDATLEEQARFRELRREYYRLTSEEGNARRTDLKKKLGNDVFNMVKNDRLSESYLEKARVGEDFKADLDKYKGAKHEDAAKKTIENAIKAGANNTNRVHDLVDMAAELSSETGYVYDFKDNEQIKNDFIERKSKEIAKLEAVENRTNAQNEKIAKLKDLVAKVQNNEVTVNGNVDSKGIVLNLDSAKPLNRIIGHEITHTVEKAKHYDKLRDSLFSYAKSKGVDIDAELEMKALEYEGVEGTTAEAELVADLVGDYLFTDSDYVKSLTTENRNLAQRIYDEIKYFLTKATQGSKEERELLRVKHEFEEAFRESAEISEVSDANTKHSLRTNPPPKETGVAYKVFFVKDGKLYPPMVANPEGGDTPMGVWLDADVGVSAPPSKTGRAQVKAGGKGTQGGSGSLAFRPGWHLGDLPRASQFDRVNPETGKKELFPENFVWAEVEYAKDVDYQEEAMSYGYTDNGKFRHAYAGLPRLPENGYYRYRTNPKPDTVPWIITGAMKVNRLLSDAEVNEILEKNGVAPVHRQGGDVGLDKFGFDESGAVKYSLLVKDKNGNISTVNPYVTTREQTNDFMVKSRKGELNQYTYFPVSAHTPGTIIATLNNAGIEVTDKPLAMQAKKARQSQIDGQHTEPDGTIIRHHAMSTDEIQEAIDKLNDAFAVIHQTERTKTIKEDGKNIRVPAPDNFVFFVTLDSGKECVAVIEFDSIIDNDMIQKDGHGDDYHTTVTVFEPDQYRDGEPFDYLEYLAVKPSNHELEIIKESPKTETAISQTEATVSEMELSGINVAQEGGNVNKKFSLSDSSGRQLSKEQQEYFKDSKAVDENGNLKVVYHGTRNADFTVFKQTATYFTDNKEMADSYSPSGDMYEGYVNITKPYEIDAMGEKWSKIPIDEATRKFLQEYGSSVFKEDGKWRTSPADIVAAIEEAVDNGDMDYDGIIIRNIDDTGSYYKDKDSHLATDYIVFNSNQFKNADNTAPTSDPDIRFSLSKTVEETKDLVAVHNLQSSELFKTIELGGLAMPSIAVIKAQQGHEQYGDVSLIFPKDTIDPKANSANKVYGGDAWTPTHPRIEYKPSEEVQKRIRDKYYELAEKFGYDAAKPLYSYVSELESALNTNGGEANMLEWLYENDKMMQVYLADSGKGMVEPVIKETRTEATETEKEMNQWFIDKLGEDVIRAYKAPEGVSPFTHRKEFMEQHGEQVKQAYRDFFAEKFGFDENTLDGIIENTQRRDLLEFIRKANTYLTDGGVTIKTETDYAATDKAIREKSADGYREWVDNLFKGVEEKSGIRNDVDVFTRSGNRRSWDALHWENTLENVVKTMKAQEQTGADAFSPTSAIFAVAHKQYDSIADIKADSNRLGRVSAEEYKALEESYASRLVKIAESIKDPGERNPFIASDRAASEIVDAVRTQKTKSGMLRYMQKWNERVTESTVDDIISLVNDIANMPTGYFEAKPQRAVGLEEVGVFVIPRNADVKLKQELLNRGYSIAEYDPNIEGDRQKVVNQFEEYKFSLSDAGKEFAPIGRNDFFGKDFRKKSADDIAPVVTDTNVGGKTTKANVTDAPVAETADVESLMVDRDSFVSQQAMELYKEITGLKKGVRASKRLGYLLDHGHEWRSIKTALLNIRDNPNQVVNPNSAAETVAREMLGREYDEMAYELSEQSDVAGNIRTKMQSIQTELANNERLREQSSADYDSEIARVQAEYDAKKNKNTIAANDLLRRIERLKRMKNTNDANYAKRIGDLEARIEKMSKPGYKTAVQRRAKQNEYTNLMKNLVGDTTTWVDKKLGISYKVNTLRRNLRDVVRDANGKRDIAKADAIYDELQGNYNHNEAELKRESKRIKQVFADLKLNHAEDTYAHMLGEFRHNPDSKLTEETVKEFYEKNKGKIDTKKVDEAIEESRKTFDELIVRVNERLKEQGMKEIPYRQGYFPHFSNPKQGWLAKLLNWKTVDTEIPTSIAGLTETFNPERSWQGFSKQRKGDTTDYSLEQGLDTYIHGALDWIYHIEDIQKRRALENHIRYIHSEEGIKARIDAINNSEELDADEAQRQIDAVYAEANNPLNNFVTNLRAGTNTLANKKSENDRQIESDTNRKIYSVMTNLNNRINANMVVGSFSSALTNFIPITQSWMEVSPVYSLRGMKDTIKSTIRDDGMVNKSDFLTNRLMNEESLYQTAWDKISDKAGFMMEAIDSFTSQTVWRSKYLQNISEGMSETEAIKNADQFAENVIAGRSRGNQPTIFDAKNPITKIFTAFQLEVNNQYGYMFKDAPQDSKNKARLIKGYATAFLGAYAYNALYSSLVGRDVAFDPIGILEDLLRDMGLFGDDDEEEEPKDVILNLTDNILDELPFVSGLTGGGRIPISSALPYSSEYEGFEGFLTDVSEGNWGDMAKEMLKPLYYLALPVGGGQIKKTVEGLSMFSDEHPVAGSYTGNGNLRFPVEDTLGNRIQAGLFGQYASENARDYFDNGRSPLKEKQIQEYIDVDIPIRDYWEYREGLAQQKTIEDKFDYIAGLDLPVAKKNILINNAVDREENVDLEGYEDFSSYDEFDFATKKPGKYAVSQAVGGYDAYSSYMDALGDLEADKDENGKSISGSKKEKVIEYIESLDLDYGQKIILFKSMYDSKEDRNNYNADIVAYLDSRDDISYEEMVTILTELGMRVEGNNVYWD